ncbi:MAG: class I SAM-dependent methyltransferase [Desulfuromonadales bacterium]
MSTKDNIHWANIDSFVGNKSHDTLLNHRLCPICGSFQYRTLLVFDDFQFSTDSITEPRRAKIIEVQCQNCDGVYLNPCYSKIGFSCLFSEAGQSYGSTEGRPQEQIDWLASRGLLDVSKVFMDAGCYEGRFLSMLPKSVRRIGVDIDTLAIERGRKRFSHEGVELIHGAFESFQCPIAPDVISMTHVLEHLADPFSVLCHLRSVSHDDTHLVIEVPVLDDGKTNDINGFLSVGHMTHFSIRSVGILLKRAGWKILEQQQMQEYNGYRLLAKPDKATVNNIEYESADRAGACDYISHWYAQLAKVAILMGSWEKAERTVIWGGGWHTEFLYQVTPLFTTNQKTEYIIVDSDPMKHGKSWRGLTINSPDVLSKIDWENTQLVISSYQHQEEIAQAALKKGIPNSVIRRLYDKIRVH